MLCAAMLGPIFAIFVEDKGGNLFDASVTFAVFATVAAVTSFITGKITDKIKEQEYVLLLGYFMIFFGYILLVFAKTTEEVILIQIILGFGDAVSLPAHDALYSHHVKKGHEGTAWGTWETMNYLVSAIGALIGGALVVTSGFDLLFFVMALLCFISIVAIAITPRTYL